MSNFEKFDAYIIDSDIDTRMRLRTATSSVAQFGKIIPLNEPRDALAKLNSGYERCDVVFLSSCFEESDVADFVRLAKESKGGQDSAYVLVLKGGDQDNNTIAKNVMLGIDGFLFEPYSVDQLIEITTLSARIRRERSAKREAVALNLMVTDIIKQIDLVSYLKSLGNDPTTSRKKLADLCSRLPTLAPEAFQTYVDIAVKLFGDAPVPARAFKTENYKGASSRVKRVMEKKLIAEIEKGAETPKDEVKG